MLWTVFLVSYLKKSSPNPRSQRFSHMLSPKSFIVLALTFKPIINFELTFLCKVRGKGLSLLLPVYHLNAFFGLVLFTTYILNIFLVVPLEITKYLISISD